MGSGINLARSEDKFSKLRVVVGQNDEGGDGCREW